MARIPRTPEDVEATKNKIIENALHIITKHGYEGFTMKALAKRLGTVAPGIYYYYANKEEILLSARRQGFLLIYEQAKRVYDSHTDPFCKLQAVTKAYIDFSLKYPHYYKILITMDVPLSPSFVGTPLQDMAFQVVEARKPSSNLIIRIMEEMADTYHSFPKEQAQIQFMLWLSGIHGIASLHSNNILKGLHESNADVMNLLVDRFLTFFKPPTIS
jgi:AcrR family transcriptional regulator